MSGAAARLLPPFNPPAPTRWVPSQVHEAGALDFPPPLLLLSPCPYLSPPLASPPSPTARWVPSKGVKLVRGADDMWVGSVRLPPGKGLEAKLVLMDGSPSGRWEPGGNRAFTLAAPIRGAAAAEKEEEEQQEEQQEGGEYSEGSSGLDHGWQDPGSCVEEAAVEAKESGKTVSAAAAAAVMPSSVVDAASGPDVALVLHWGLAVYSQVLPIPSRRPARTASAPAPLGVSSSLVDAAAVAQCSFVVPHFPTCPGQHLMLVGSAPELGGWNAGEALKLTWQPGHAWVGEAQLPNTGKLEAKVGGAWVHGDAWVHGSA